MARLSWTRRLQSVRIEELTFFEVMLRSGSIAGGAREMGWNVPHASKVLKRIESSLGVSLVKRGAKGVLPTPEGLRLLDLGRSILEAIEDSDLSLEKTAIVPTHPVTCVGTSYLITHLLAPFGAPVLQREGWRVRSIEASPVTMVSDQLNDSFDIAIHEGSLPWNKQWKSFEVGPLESRLFGRKGHPLGHRSSSRQVLAYPFVLPLVWHSDGARAGKDHCPIPARGRIAGNETTTAPSGLEMVTASDQLIFIPEIVARSAVRDGRVQAIEVRDWPPVLHTVFVTAHLDRVSQPLVRSLLRALGAGLSG